MIASLTFTYGTEREDIFKYKKKDLIDQTFRNALDYNLYLFHNSEPTYIAAAKKNLTDFNLTIAEGYGPYPQVLKEALLFLKNKGVEKIVFMQDDVYTNYGKNMSLIENLTNFIKKTEIPYLNLEIVCEDSQRKIIADLGDFKIYDTDTDYHKKRGWSFDDSPYYATMDYALNVIYDETYYSYPDIWSAEWYLKHKFEVNNVPRFTTNKCIFRRVNFVGRHNHNRDNELKFLNEHFS